MSKRVVTVALGFVAALSAFVAGGVMMGLMLDVGLYPVDDTPRVRAVLAVVDSWLAGFLGGHVCKRQADPARPAVVLAALLLVASALALTVDWEGQGVAGWAAYCVGASAAIGSLMGGANRHHPSPRIRGKPDAALPEGRP
jgi:hypothetical protein